MDFSMLRGGRKKGEYSPRTELAGSSDFEPAKADHAPATLQRYDGMDQKRASSKMRKLSLSEIENEIARVKARRAADQTARCDFSGRLIADIDFTEISDLIEDPNLLSAADFSGSNILGCSFGPVFLPDRAQDLAIREDRWRGQISVDLERANFENAYVFHSNFSGANISRANFSRAFLIHSRFDLAFAAGSYSWMRAKFVGARLEFCRFRGAVIRGNFIDAELIKCDFTQANLPTFDVKKTDPRIKRLSSPVTVKLSVGEQSLLELIHAKRKEIEDSSQQDERKIWNKIFSVLQELNEGGMIPISLRSLVRCKLDESIFEDSFIYKSDFRAAIIEQHVKFDRSFMFDVDFTPAQIDELPWRPSIIMALKEKIAERVDGVNAEPLSIQLGGFLTQVAERVEDEADIIADETGHEHAGGVVATRMSTASFDEVMMGEAHLSKAIARKSQFVDAVVAETYFENADMQDAQLDNAIFIRTPFDGASLAGASALCARFDGDLIDSAITARIEDLMEVYSEKIKNIGEGSRKGGFSLRGGAKQIQDEADSSDNNDDPIADEAAIVNADTNIQRNFRNYCGSQAAYRRALSEAAQFIGNLIAAVDSEPVGAETGQWAAQMESVDSCSFIGANISGLDGRGASFKGCMLENARFTHANLGQNETYGPAKFDRADLSSVDFHGAALNQVSFFAATVTGITGLRAARALEGANFLESRGLKALEFARADLTGVILPAYAEGFGGVLQSVEQLTRQARILFATLMFACAYSALALTVLPSENTDLKLPVIGVEVPKNVFLVVTPMLIVAFFLMFHLKFSRIWLEAKWLPHRFPDERVVDRHLFPWIFASLVPAFLKTDMPADRRERASHKFSERFISGTEQALAIIFGWAIVPVVLLLFVFKQLRQINGDEAAAVILGVPFHPQTMLLLNKGLAGFAILVSGLTLFQLFFSTPKWTFKKREREERRQEKERKKVTSRLNSWWVEISEFIARLRHRLFQASAAAVIAVVAFSLTNLNVVLHGVSQGAPNVLNAAAARVVSNFADQLGYTLFSKGLSDAAIHSPRPNNARGSRKFLYLMGADGAGESVDLSSSYIVRANFEHARLAGANFSDAELHFANFVGASLEETKFNNAKLKNVDFSNASGLTPMQFAGACNLGGTVMPAGVHSLPACDGE